MSILEFLITKRVKLVLCAYLSKSLTNISSSEHLMLNQKMPKIV